jgi:hypothetical protein
MKKIILILLIALLPSLSFASFTVRLENNLDRTLFYFIDWLDHPYGWRTPANMAGGELAALENRHLGGSFQPGRYRITWRDRNQWKKEMLIHVKKNVTLLTIQPERVSNVVSQK